MKKLYFILYCLFFSALYGQQSSLPFVNFNEKDGFPEKFVYSVQEGSPGELWLGTANGLYLYNGKIFQKISSTADRPGHQISNILQNMYKDKDGRLWLSSMNAVQVFDTRKGTFQSLNYNDSTIDRMIKGFVTGFFRDSKKQLWITTQKESWYRYDEKTKEASQIVFNGKFADEGSKFVSKILETPDGKLWAFTTNGLFQFSENRIEYAYFNQKKGIPEKNYFLDAYYDPIRNCFWMATGYDGIAKFDLNDKTFHYHPFVDINSPNSNKANYISLVCPKNDNEIWYGAYLLGSYSIVSNAFKNVSTTGTDEYTFKTVPVSRILKDKEKNLWVCSYNGLSQLPWQNNQVRTLPLFNTFANYTVEPYATIDYKGTDLLIANNTSNGLLWWKNKEQSLALIQNPFYKNQFKALQGIQSVVRNSHGTIYATSEEHFFVLDQAQNKLIPLTILDQNGKAPKGVIRMIADEKDNLYLYAPNNGFYVYNEQTHSLQHFNLWEVDKKSKNASSNLISPRKIDRKQNVWFTMTDGVYCLETNTRKFRHYATGKAINNHAVLVQSIDVTEDLKGNIWITTRDNGIFELRLTPKKEPELWNYTKDNSGLPSDFCGNIYCDSKGVLWIGTLSGLTRFDSYSKKTLSVLTKQQGLADNAINVSFNVLPMGDLVINHYGALSIVPFKKYQTNSHVPTVQLSNFKILDQKVPKEQLDNLTFTLEHNQNFINFEWTSSLFNNANQNRFLYKLNDVDKEWVLTDKNSISYSGLTNGRYVFELKAFNNDGVESKVRKWIIVIQPPFWKTWWFYTLLGILVGSVLYFFYRYKLKQIQKQEELKTQYAKQIAEIEMKALRAQMNPHFIFNSLNSIQKYILKNDSFQASQYLTKFSKLIRLILDHSNQNYILLSSEIDLLSLYIEIEDLRFDNQFLYELTVDPRLSPDICEIPSMIIQPYIENAIWHGLLHKKEKGTLKVSFQKEEEDTVKVIIEDDGIGREQAKVLKSKQVLKKKSYGLQITGDRISILNALQNKKTTVEIVDLKDAKGDSLGTQVILIIPIQNIEK